MKHIINRKIIFNIAFFILAAFFCKEAEAVTVSQNQVENERATYTSETDFEYKVENRSAVITAYTGDAVRVTLPQKIDGLYVSGFTAETFQGNEEIRSVDFNGIDLGEIEDYAFYGCTSLGGVYNYGLGTYRIGDYAFYGCESLVTIDMGGMEIGSIGDYAFYGCAEFQDDIYTHFGFNKIGDYAFYGCESIERFIQYSGGGTIYVGEGAFMRSGIEKIYWSDSYDPVVELSDAAFAFCENLTEVNVAPFEVLPDYAFAGCTNLKTVKLPNLDMVGKYAFAGSFPETAEPNVHIPKVTYIDDYAFYDSKIQKIELPDDLESVGANAFLECPMMKEITIPEQVQEIGDRAFGYETYDRKMTDFKVEAPEGSEGFVYGVENGFIDHVHVYTEEVLKEPSCRAKGRKVLTCKACWHEYEEEIPVLQHSFGAGKIINAPTKKKNGKIEFTCNNCGQKVKQSLPVLKLERGDRFKKDGFSFRVLSAVDKTVRLLEYKGNGTEVTIPAKITYNGVSYKVKFINCYSFKKNNMLKTIYVENKKVKKQIKAKVGDKKVVVLRSRTMGT